MKICLVRGTDLSPRELALYAPLAEHHELRVIGGNWQFYSRPFEFPALPIQFAPIWGGRFISISPKAPWVLNKMLSAALGRSFGIWNLEKWVGKPDILHSMETYHTTTYQCLLLKKKLGCALVVTVNENLPGRGDLHILRKQRKYRVLQEADTIIAISEMTRQMLLNEGVSTERIVVVPPAINTTQFAPAPRSATLSARLGVGPQDLVVLYIGRFAREKGVADLLTAIPLILQQRSDQQVRFCFVGEGPMKHLILQAQKQYPRHVIWHPFVPYEEIVTFHQLADIFVFPSIPLKTIAEQFGYALVEAMSCEKAVVVTTTGSLSEVVGDAGRMVSPAQPEKLADAINELLASKERRLELGRKARLRILQRFDASQVANRLEAVYRKTLAQARGQDIPVKQMRFSFKWFFKERIQIYCSRFIDFLSTTAIWKNQRWRGRTRQFTQDE